jgi:hypothetical protein
MSGIYFIAAILTSGLLLLARLHLLRPARK